MTASVLAMKSSESLSASKGLASDLEDACVCFRDPLLVADGKRPYVRLTVPSDAPRGSVALSLRGPRRWNQLS